MSKSELSICILLPDMSLPWKEPARLDDRVRARFRSPEVRRVRAPWTKFAELAATAFRDAGHTCQVRMIPGWEIDADYVATLSQDLVLVPHRGQEEFIHLDRAILFYMQVFCRWLFTVDPSGWSAGASLYPHDKAVRRHEADPGTFEVYKRRLCGGNDSKFLQPSRRSLNQLVEESGLPDEPYIFFPCQIPHDQSLLLFSEWSEVEVLRELIEWSADCKHYLVLKEHPANRASMQPLKELPHGSHVRWVDASVHDLIAYSRAVYTINSGTGFEAILQDKPVVTFGRSDYDCVTIKAVPSKLDQACRELEAIDTAELKLRYRQFVSWFTTVYAVDIELDSNIGSRVQRLVEDAERFTFDRASSRRGTVPSTEMPWRVGGQS